MATNLSWSRAQPGTVIPRGNPPTHSIWTRNQTLLESWSIDVSKIITSIRLSPPNRLAHALNLDIIKAAVRQLRFDHPAIASQGGVVTETSTPVFVYLVPDSENDIDQWLSEVVLDKTDISMKANGDMDEAIENITHDLGKPLERPLFLVHYLPAVSPNGPHALVFWFNHSVFDAIGAIQMMDLCLSRISDSLAMGGEMNHLPWGEETSRLPPAHSESAKIPHTAEKSSEDELMVQRARNSMKAMLTAHKLPVPHPNSPPAGTGLVTRIASPDIVTSLRDSARAHGCTIFTVLWAAMVLSTVRTRAPDVTANKDLTLPFIPSPVDLRYLACDDRYDRSQWKARLSMGFNSYVAEDLARFVHSSALHTDDSKLLVEDLWGLAKEVREQMKEQQSYTERMPVWIDDMLATIGEGAGLLGNEAALPTKWYPILSSIGVMDKYLAQSYPVAFTGEHLTISSPRLSPTCNSPFLGAALALHAFTWQGDLMLAFTFPEGIMGTTQEQMKALKEGHDVDGIVLEFIDEFMHILSVTAGLK